jgi:hypothetical protein
VTYRADRAPLMDHQLGQRGDILSNSAALLTFSRYEAAANGAAMLAAAAVYAIIWSLAEQRKDRSKPRVRGSPG